MQQACQTNRPARQDQLRRIRDLYAVGCNIFYSRILVVINFLLNSSAKRLYLIHNCCFVVCIHKHIIQKFCMVVKHILLKSSSFHKRHYPTIIFKTLNCFVVFVNILNTHHTHSHTHTPNTQDKKTHTHQTHNTQHTKHKTQSTKGV